MVDAPWEGGEFVESVLGALVWSSPLREIWRGWKVKCALWLLFSHFVGAFVPQFT